MGVRFFSILPSKSTILRIFNMLEYNHGAPDLSKIRGEEMIISNGKNNYQDNKYSFWEWSAPILQTHDEVMAKIKDLKLHGRVIKGFYTVGMGYNWCEDDIGDAIYNSLEVMIKEKRISPDGPFPFLPEGVYIPRYAEIDEPFLIEFEDGDILGIDYSEGSCVRLEMNTIPKDIDFGINRKTFHPDMLFESLIGKKILSVEVTTSTELAEFTWSHGLDIDEQDSYITKLSIVCEKENERQLEKLEFSSFFDYGIVALTNYGGAPMTIHAPDIKDVVAGFVDEETLNLLDDYQFDE